MNKTPFRLNRKYRNYLLYAVAAVVALFLLVFLRGDSETNNKILLSNSADSLWAQLSKIKEGSYEMVTFRELHRLSQMPNKKSEHDKLLGLALQRGEREGNQRVQVYYNINKSFNLIWVGSYDSALQCGQRAMELGKSFTDISPCMYYSPISISYYQLGNWSEAINFMKMGYEHAKKVKDYANLNSYATNLGTYYFNNGMYGSASRYFHEAVAAGQKNGKISNVLINNIISIKSTELGVLSTIEDWKNYDSILSKPSNEFERQLTLLNKVNLFQAQKRWEEASRLLQQVPDSALDLYFIINKMSLVLNDLNRKPDRLIRMSEYVVQHKHWLRRNFTQGLMELHTNLNDVIQYNPNLLPLDTLFKWEVDNDANLNQNALAKSFLNELYAKHYASSGNYVMSSNRLSAAMVYTREYMQTNDSLKRADFIERMENARINEKLDDLTIELQQKTQRNQLVTIVLIALLLILGLTILVLWLLNRKREKSLELIQVQLHQQEEEQRFLRKERELNDRIVSITHMMMEKTGDLVKQLKGMKSANKEDLEEIRKALEAMVRVDTGSNPQMADTLMKENDALLNNYPAIKDLNLTERRIFILSVEGFKSKDISNLVGVTPQYIHNVRSKIRKILNLENQIHWEELK
jgi:tetratricopeptide (TPR) repeat protein